MSVGDLDLHHVLNTTLQRQFTAKVEAGYLWDAVRGKRVVTLLGFVQHRRQVMDITSMRGSCGYVGKDLMDGMEGEAIPITLPC